MKKSLLFFALVLASYGTIQAQVTTSSMTGVVTQSSGQVTVGATIKATHLPSGTNYSGSANSSGRFNLANMRVGGPYRIEVTFVGQDPVVYNDVYLQLGQAFVLNPVFGNDATAIEEVTVVGRRGQRNEKTGAATNIGLKQIQQLPQVRRSITEFTRLTPQANGNSFAGRDARFNNLQIDGANFNNGFGLSGEPLPGGASQPISLDAIEEISVNIAPFDITNSGFTGAGINAVTKSGTNEIKGTVYGFFNNEYLNGVKIKGNNISFLEGARKNYGFSLGGPIIKNKLFFFVNGEREESTGANASGANIWRASANGIADPSNNITRVKENDLKAVQEHLMNRWNYDPGRYQGYADNAIQYGNKFLTRIDWNINDKHKLALRYNLLSASQNSLVSENSGPVRNRTYDRVSQYAMTFENANYITKNLIQSLTAELNSNFNAHLSNKFLATYSRIQTKRERPNNSGLFPFVEIYDGAGNTYINAGNEPFTYLNDVINDNIILTNNLTYTTGKHTITGGGSFEIQKFGNSYVRIGTGYYRYASVDDFLKTGTANEVAPTVYGITYPYEGQDTYSRISFGLASLYAQDRFSVNDRFNVTVGVRAEMPVYMNKLTANPGIDNLDLLDVNGGMRRYSSSTWPKSRIIVSPRVGFNYDVYGDRSLTLRGGTGIFSGRVPFVWLTNMPTNAGVIQNNVEPTSIQPWTQNVRFHPEDIYYHVKNVPAGAESVFIKNPSGGAPSSFSLVDNNFKMPTVWRSGLGADYKIPNTPLTLTTDLLYTKDVFAPFQFGANRQSSGLKMDAANGNREFYPNAASYQVNGAIAPNNVQILTNTKTKGYAYSATFGVNMSEWKGLSGSIFYTYSTAKDISSNAGSSAASAWSGSPSINNPNDQMLQMSEYAIPHRIVANVNYSIGNSSFGIFYNGAHQGRFSYYYGGSNNDVNGDGLADLLYLPQNLNDIKFVDIVKDGKLLFTAAEQHEAFEKFVNDNGLASHKGSILGRNDFLMPWLNRFDVRWTQNLFGNIFKRADKLQLTVDILNVGNLLSSNWGVGEFILASGRSPLTRSGAVSASPSFVMSYETDPVTKNPYLVKSPTFTANTTAATWRAMLGLRYSF